MAEYWFLLEDNRQNKLCLNDLIMLRLSLAQKSELNDRGYSGEFMRLAGPNRHDNRLNDTNGEETQKAPSGRLPVCCQPCLRHTGAVSRIF